MLWQHLEFLPVDQMSEDTVRFCPCPMMNRNFKRSRGACDGTSRANRSLASALLGRRKTRNQPKADNLVLEAAWNAMPLGILDPHVVVIHVELAPLLSQIKQ